MIETVQGLLATLFSFYDSIFQPLLATSPYYALAFFSVGLAGTFSLIYWRFLDIERQKELKEKLNKQQEKMKEARENEETDKVSEHMTKSLELNQKFMMLNLKPMMVTMLFVGLFFPWLGATFSPSVDLANTNGAYTGDLEYAGEEALIEVQNVNESVMNVDGQEVQPGETFEAHGITWEYRSVNEAGGGFFSSGEGYSAKVAAVFVPLPFSIWYVGGALNWLGFYILMAMPLTFAFRRMLGIA
ncbi:MAG: EMC3/TMCO1 family protein [Candidatus Nanohaloarchaea archaeon]